MAEKRRYDEAHRRATQKYRRKAVTTISFSLGNESDAEIIEIYRSIPDKAQWFRRKVLEFKETGK